MIEMDNKQWNEKIKNNFNDAAYRYLEYSNIQKFFAKKIVQFIFLDFLNKTLDRKPILIKLAQQGHCLNNLNLYEILLNTFND